MSSSVFPAAVPRTRSRINDASTNRGMFELGNVVIREHTNSGKLCLPNWYEAGKPHNRKRSKTGM